jgi:hypothetical protein
LRMFVLNRIPSISGRSNCKGAVEFVMNNPFFKVPFDPLNPNKWVCDQFVAAVETTTQWTPISNSLDLCLHLTNTLSPDEPPSLREIVMIRYLHAELNYDAKEMDTFVSSSLAAFYLRF